MIDRARLDRLRNYQSQEFWAILFLRPMAILLLWIVADWRFVTPNRLTIIGIGLTFATAWLIAFGGRPEHLAAAVCINAAQVFDNADGTLARYRRSGTYFGSFLDKTGDCVGYILVFAAISWIAAEQTGDSRYALLGPAAAAFLLLRGYGKWVSVAQHQQASARKPTVEAPPIDAAAEAPPRRSLGAWAMLVGKAVVRAPAFEEVDLAFWIALGLIIERLDLLAIALCASQAIGCLIMLGVRGVKARQLDLSS
jgi:phosphatidylglycerophosphate synthase